MGGKKKVWCCVIIVDSFIISTPLLDKIEGDASNTPHRGHRRQNYYSIVERFLVVHFSSAY